jgi:hypothetical protein
MQYKYKPFDPTAVFGIIRLEDDGISTFIPAEPANADWVKFQDWLAQDPENNLPLPADE